MGGPRTLFGGLDEARADLALITPGQSLNYRELAERSSAVAAAIGDARRVAVWATPSAETCVALVAALRAGVTAVPMNPGAGESELGHVVGDSQPELVLHPAAADLPPALADLPRLAVSTTAPPGEAKPRPEPPSTEPALILYTSGTTGPPKGVVLSRSAVEADIDGLAVAWDWSRDDVVAHALPLFHAHGLVLGVFGPLRVGGAAMLLGRFEPAAAAAALRGPATVFFGVPTMYRRLRLAAEEDPEIAAGLAQARLLVSGSAPLPVSEHVALERATGQRLLERYGMTETMITLAARADGPRTPGSVGVPVPGVDVRLVDDDGAALPPGAETLGELQVKGPTLFDGYLDLPGPTKDAYAGAWLKTGDIATQSPDGEFRIHGRRHQDLIKTGGFRVGAGEVEATLAEHPAVAEVAVTGAPDEDLGQRILAWVVLHEDHQDDDRPTLTEDLTAHVSTQLATHKRPREVHFIDALPRNALGKVVKSRLEE